MSDSIVLDTPAQINMWVLLSRRGQLKLQLKGLKTPGLIKWCKENIPGCEKARTAKDCVVPVEYAISQAGGAINYNLVNVHVMMVRGGLFHDRGIVPDMSHVEENPAYVKAYEQGKLELVLTLDEPRMSNGEIYLPA